MMGRNTLGLWQVFKCNNEKNEKNSGRSRFSDMRCNFGCNNSTSVKTVRPSVAPCDRPPTQSKLSLTDGGTLKKQ